MSTHTHKFQGQTLRHDHPGGDLTHGYFEHPEDGVPHKSGTPMADALAAVDKAMADGFTSQGEARPHLSRALWQLSEAVRASLTAFSEGDVRMLAEVANDLGGGAMYLKPEQRRLLDKALALFGLTPGLSSQSEGQVVR